MKGRLHWVSALAAFLAAALFSVTAIAKPLELRVGLAIADESAPTHVCVIAAGKGSDDSETVESLHDTGQLCGAATDGECKFPAAVGAQFWFVPKAQRSAAPRSQANKLTAFRGTGGTTNEHSCEYGGSIGCRPVFRLDGIPKVRNAYVTCVANDTYAGEPMAPGALKTRALVLNLLALHDDAGPHVQSLRLTGKQLLIGLSPTLGVDHLVRVLGGFYAPVGEARFTSESRSVSLAIEPRCEWTTIEVPRGVIAAEVETSLVIANGRMPTKPKPSDLKATPQCVTSASETSLRVLLPYADGGRKVLRMSRDGGGGRGPWALKTTWYGARPLGGRPPPLKMSVTEFSFEWQRDECLYPGPDTTKEAPRCPQRVESAASGVACEPYSDPKPPPGRSASRVCLYRCRRSETGDEAGVVFPTQITFRSGDMQWTTDVDAFDHRSAPYVVPTERIFQLDLDAWSSAPGKGGPTFGEAREILCPARRAFDPVYDLQITTPDGRRTVDLHGYYGCGKKEPTDGEDAVAAPFVKLPRASCNEPLQYRFIGERGYDEATTKIVHGRLEIGLPTKKARLVHYSVTLLPGAIQFVAAPRRFRNGLPWTPVVEGGVVFMPRKRARGWRLKVDLTVMGSKRPFHAISEEVGRSEVVRGGDTTHYIRTYLGFSFLSRWYGPRYDRGYGRAFAWGIGIQPGVGTSLKLAHAKRLGGPDWGLLALRFEARVRFTRYLEGVFSPRVLLVERDVAFTTDFQGQPVRSREKRMVSLVVPAGLGFVW